MNYFQVYLPSLDEAIVAAWDSQILDAADTPWLAQALAKRAELFPRFAARYAELRALPRGARRALQRQLARSHVPANVPAEWQRKLASSLAGAALLLALGQGTAQALVINVDANKTNIKSGDGFCSLIEAIDNANDAATGTVHTDCTAGDPAGADDIVLTLGSVHTLTKVNNTTLYGATGLPVITSPITITGNGATIRRRGTAPRFRIFAVDTTGDLTLNNVTLSGGRTGNVGGAVFNYGNLTVDNSTISGNRAFNGGGIFNDDNATVTIINSSIISGNRASYAGGGLFIDNSSTATVQDSTITGNRARVYGGGIDNYIGSLTISNSTITGNKARSGGGLYNYNGPLTITNSTISGNTASRIGGGMASFVSFTNYPGNITGSIITGNKARYGGGIAVYNHGSLSELTIDSSTISMNTGTLAGGGIANYALNAIISTVIVTNSDVWENKAVYAGGILNLGDLSFDSGYISDNRATGRRFSAGGGIVNYGPLTLTNATISGNRAKFGGGIANLDYFYLGNSSITGNTATRVGGGVINFPGATYNNVGSLINSNTPDDVYYL